MDEETGKSVKAAAATLVGCDVVYTMVGSNTAPKNIRSLTPPSEDPTVPLRDVDRPYLSNHTKYGGPDSENREHDSTGSAMNYSGVKDDVMNAFIEHEDWQEGYDF